MHADYSDIKLRISEEPTWYDMNGAPRYGDFHPRLIPSIYAKVCVLLRIKCQACGQEFLVEMHNDLWGLWNFVPKNLHYGDPPRHDCDCRAGGAGESMNCEDLEVVQAWRHARLGDWERVPELEGMIE